MVIGNLSKRLFSFAIIAVALLPITALTAQSHRASVRGVVIDPSRKAMPGVSFRITNEETAELRAGMTGEDGHFTVTMLPPGTYRIEVEQPGYKKYVSRTELQINQEFWLEISLQLGNVTEEIVVTTPLVPLAR